MRSILSRNVSWHRPDGAVRGAWKCYGWVKRHFAHNSRLRDDAVRSRLAGLRRPVEELFPRLNPQTTALSCRQFVATYQYLAPGESVTKDDVLLYGKVQNIRFAGSRLVFLDISRAATSIQVLSSLKDLNNEVSKDNFKTAFRGLQRGDIITVRGYPHRTSTGELSLRSTALPELLSPSLHPMPNKLQDEATRIKQRHVDLHINSKIASTLHVRSAILQHIRRFLLEDGHIEVQTPILANGAGGAVARSFQTSATEFPEKNINLRIAPELWLKRLIVGGLDRVFEIGPSFRNEGLDLTHNPEFTTCEFYRAFTGIQKLLSMTEDLFSGLMGLARKMQHSQGLDMDIPQISFDGPYPRLDFIPCIEAASHCKLPDLRSPDARAKVVAVLSERSIPFNESNTLPQLLDRLSTHYLESQCAEPTWIINHPECLSPLSKSFFHESTRQWVAARGELFVQGREIVNTYEEENSPFEQRRKFEQQLGFHSEENEAYVDEGYLEVLEWGMPPTGGWGCGIDRLCMLITGTGRINDVLSFGNLRNVVSLRHS